MATKSLSIKDLAENVGQIQGWFAKMFGASPLPISITTLDEGRFVDVNDSFLALSGYDREELIGRTTVEVGFWDSLTDRRLGLDVAQEKSVVSGFMEKPLKTKSGKLRQCELAIDTFEYDGQQYATVIANDITRRKKAELALAERLKELDCLYGISRLGEQHGNSLDSLLHGIANLLPPAWQYPDICCGRVVLHDKQFATSRFCNADSRLTADIRVRGKAVGQVAVCYSMQMPEADEGPFLKEERLLIDAVAERVGKMVERIEMRRQLETEHAALEEANVALRVTMARIHDEKRVISKAIAENVDAMIVPVLDELAAELPQRQKQLVAMAKRHLEDITLPYIGRLRTTIEGLTPVETEICNLIRTGQNTQQIAQLRNVSPATVNKHRERIRRKLHIQGTDVNLTTHLQTLVSRR